MRVRLSAPYGGCAKVRFLDSLHGALVNAWTSCGVPGPAVVGRDASNWSFGALGTATSKGFVLKAVVIGTEGGAPSPLDLNTLKALKRSTLGLDLYLWLWCSTAPSRFALRYGSPGGRCTVRSVRTRQRQATTTPFNTFAARFCAS